MPFSSNTATHAEAKKMTNIPFTIVAQDAELLVLDKVRGFTIDTVIEHVRSTIPDAASVHRLDRDTSGVLLVAHNIKVQELLQAQFKARQVRKEYLALLDGNLPSNYAHMQSYLSRSRKHRMQMQSYPRPVSNRNCRYAASEFFVLQRFHQRLNLVKINLSTGRTHQIRVHAVDLGAPVLGDNLYHRPTQLPQTFAAPLRETVHSLSAQMLHASRIEFKHPRTNKNCCFDVPPPADFNALLAALEEDCAHANSN